MKINNTILTHNKSIIENLTVMLNTETQNIKKQIENIEKKKLVILVDDIIYEQAQISQVLQNLKYILNDCSNNLR